MPLYFENFGMDYVYENEDYVNGFAAMTAERGRAIEGRGCIYINYEMNKAIQLIAKIRTDEDGKHLLVGLDTHIPGGCVWDARVVNRTHTLEEDERCLRDRYIFQREDGSGMFVANVVNARVRSFEEGDVVKLQVAAFPLQIDFYDDEEAYAEAVPRNEKGEKWLMGAGTIMPANFIINHNPKTYDREKNYENDDIVQICGYVTAIFEKKVLFDNGDEVGAFLVVRISTDYGELDVAVSYDMVKNRKIIAAGNLAVMLAVISCDAAIFEYENGAL